MLKVVSDSPALPFAIAETQIRRQIQLIPLISEKVRIFGSSTPKGTTLCRVLIPLWQILFEFSLEYGDQRLLCTLYEMECVPDDSHVSVVRYTSLKMG